MLCSHLEMSLYLKYSLRNVNLLDSTVERVADSRFDIHRTGGLRV